jgi:hypothetical protein
MAEEQQVAEESLGKLTWGYIGVGVLWVSLLLTGIVFERLGLTSSLFSSVLPGDVGFLTEQKEQCDAALKTVTQDREEFSQRIDAYQLKIDTAKNKVTDLKKELDDLKSAAAPPPAPAAEAVTEAAEAAEAASETP